MQTTIAPSNDGGGGLNWYLHIIDLHLRILLLYYHVGLFLCWHFKILMNSPSDMFLHWFFVYLLYCSYDIFFVYGAKKSLKIWAIPGLFFFYFFLFNIIQLTVKNKCCIKICRCLDSNRGPLVSEATALPTESQPLPKSRKVLQWKLRVFLKIFFPFCRHLPSMCESAAFKIMPRVAACIFEYWKSLNDALLRFLSDNFSTQNSRRRRKMKVKLTKVEQIWRSWPLLKFIIISVL